MTGVMSTAVVSKDMNAVLTVTMARTNTHSSARRPRPPDGQAFGDDGEHSRDAGELGDDGHGDDEDEDGSSRLRELRQILAGQTTGDDREDRDRDEHPRHDDVPPHRGGIPLACAHTCRVRHSV